MRLIPRNRHLLVELLPEPEKEALPKSAFLLPEDYNKVEHKRHVAVRLLDSAPDCLGAWNSQRGYILIVEQSMLQDVQHDGANYLLVLENYVCAAAANTT